MRELSALLNGTDYHYLARNTRTVPLTDDLFDNDSHCMLNLRSKTLAIVEKDTGRAVRCNIEGYPYVLIWSKPEKPYRFVCIEPWHSLPGEENGPLTWEDRPCTPAKPGPPHCAPPLNGKQGGVPNVPEQSRPFPTEYFIMRGKR